LKKVARGHEPLGSYTSHAHPFKKVSYTFVPVLCTFLGQGSESRDWDKYVGRTANVRLNVHHFIMIRLGDTWLHISESNTISLLRSQTYSTNSSQHTCLTINNLPFRSPVFPEFVPELQSRFLSRMYSDRLGLLLYRYAYDYARSRSLLFRA